MNNILIIIPILIVVFPTLIRCQLNGVKPGLISCYNVSAIPGITNANNRPPANLNIFLEMLRRLEDANPTVTVRELSYLLVQRLKQNGIIETGSMDLNLGIPYTPYSMEADKGTVVSTYYLTNSSLNLEYGDLDMADVCAFHYMISNTMNVSVRGDESQTCVRSARYQTRMRRKASEYDDFEELSSRQSGLQGSYDVGELSQCPLELGVIYTNYGTIKIGQVLQGLAAGLNQQVVNGVDNRYAATLSSDLDHVALIQRTKNLNIGVQGGWNSTINPKYFFLQKNQDLELTDQDIKGSVDGLLLALKLDDIKNKFSDIKLSQIIDMYYSPYQKGVFDSSLRACNRNILYSELVSTDYLQSQTITFVKPLDNDGNYPGTFSDKGYSALATSATNNFTSYLPRLNDLACPQVDSAVERVNTDLLIFLDPTWNYNTLQPVLSYILDNIDVNKFGSRYTVFRGSDGVNITNTSTRYLLDFHKQYNLSVHQKLPTNFNYGKVYNVLESIAKSKLNNNSYTGGESTVVLLVPKVAPNEDQKSYLNEKKENARLYLPDLSVLVLGTGTAGDYSSLLFNPSRDFIPLTETLNDNELKNIGQNVIDNIRAVPRAIINPSCGSGFYGSQNSFTFSDNVELHGINYYKIAPHYFYKGEGSKTLKITEMSSGSVTVCLSRDDSRPNNQTGDCQTLKSEVKSIDITNYCGDSLLQGCAPIYFSIYGNTTLYKCTDKKCRFPSNIKYSIGMDNAGCSSSAIAIVSNFILVALLFLFLRF